MISFFSKISAVAALSMVMVSGLACGGGSGGGTGGAGVGGATAGAGGGAGGAPGSGSSRFVGTWHPTSGAITITCAGQPTTEAVTENVVWGAGIGADLVQTSGTCVLKANITSSTAVALPSQTCTQVEGTDSLMVTFSAYTFSLSADGVIATESSSGPAVVSSGGLTLTCTYSESASYQKISN